MSMQAEGKDAKGRNFHQSTTDGTGSAASVGTGGTGDAGSMGGGAGGSQQASRSDDLLAGETTQQESEQAFNGQQGGAIRTGMEGIGNQQSGRQPAQGGERQRQGADVERGGEAQGGGRSEP